MTYLQQAESQTESRLELPGAWRRGEGKLLLNGHRVSFWEDEVLEIVAKVVQYCGYN
jgi:hypothetical protein